MLRRDRLTQLVDEKLHAIDFLQQVVGKLDICLVDFIDQQYNTLFSFEGLPKLAFLNIVCNVIDAIVTKLRIAQA